MSVSVRYVAFVIQERLINEERTESTDAEAMLQILLNGIAKVKLTIDKPVSQYYDGASNMRGTIAGV